MLTQSIMLFAAFAKIAVVEPLEAATVATAFGGGPTMAYSSAILVAALDEFEKEFQ